MLPLLRLPGSWTQVLASFRWCFTAPTFLTFVSLVSGLVARPQARTVTGMLIGAGLSRQWHHSRAHRFFSRAVWSLDQVSMVLLTLILQTMLAPGAGVLIAVDDTLFTRSGRRVAGTGWHHDGSLKTKGPRDSRVRWGHCWVIAAVVVDLPGLNRPVSLPVAFALWVNQPGSKAAEQSKQALAGRLVTMITTACAGRQVDVVADCWYAGADGAPGAGRGPNRHRGLPPGVTLTARLRANAVLTHIADTQPGRRGGRPKRIGVKIGTAADLAAHHDTAWTSTTVNRYGRTDTVTVADTLCLWYGAYRSRTVRIILIRDTARTHGYDIALITTDLHNPAETIIARYAARWCIEVAIGDAKQTTGAGEARNRTSTAVHRTVAIALITQSLVVIWHTHHGDLDVTDRRDQAPWYTTKTRPAYPDMITQLRRAMIAARFRGPNPEQPTPQQIHAIHLAWQQAAA
jgi:hypothetical protein